jgi:hypothetical protein
VAFDLTGVWRGTLLDRFQLEGSQEGRLAVDAGMVLPKSAPVAATTPVPGDYVDSKPGRKGNPVASCAANSGQVPSVARRRG